MAAGRAVAGMGKMYGGKLYGKLYGGKWAMKNINIKINYY